jgi:hypothetical protein
MFMTLKREGSMFSEPLRMNHVIRLSLYIVLTGSVKLLPCNDFHPFPQSFRARKAVPESRPSPMFLLLLVRVIVTCPMCRHAMQWMRFPAPLRKPCAILLALSLSKNFPHGITGLDGGILSDISYLIHMPENRFGHKKPRLCGVF